MHTRDRTADRLQALKLIGAGYSLRAIGAQLGCSYEYVRQLLPRRDTARRLYGRRQLPSAPAIRHLIWERRRRHLSQCALARLLGCHYSTISAYETGALALPSTLLARVQALPLARRKSTY